MRAETRVVQPTKIAGPFLGVGVYPSRGFDSARFLSTLAGSAQTGKIYWSGKRRVVALSVLTIAVLALAVLVFIWNPFTSFVSTARNTPQENQIVFVGAGFSETKAVRNSNITGDFRVNMTVAGRMQFTLNDETYYPSSSMGNANSTSLGRPVHTFQSGFITVNGARFNFVSAKPCVATIASTQTNGSTVIGYASCNASTTPIVITTGPLQISIAGVWQFDYSLHVPDNATIGTYLVDILIQNSSAQNFANMSNNLVYVLTVNVTQ